MLIIRRTTAVTLTIARLPIPCTITRSLRVSKLKMETRSSMSMSMSTSNSTGGSGKSGPIVREFVSVEGGSDARGQTDAIRFRLVSYNILAQEVDEFDSFYKKSMEDLGYSSIYIQRSGQKRDGCGIFYKKNCAELLLEETIDYNDLVPLVHGETFLSSDKQNAPLASGNKGDDPKQDLSEKFSELSVKGSPEHRGDPNDPRVRLKRDCVGVMAAFKLKHPFHHVVILANTHLYWDPEWADVKLAQAKYLLARLSQFKTRVTDRFERTPSVILCGDFNSTPGDKVYQYLISGNSSSTSSDRSLEELPLPLCSLYASTSGEPPFTNCTPDFTDTLDYVFFSPSDRLKPVSILQLPELDSPDVAGALPNYSHPSDHLPIGAEFEISKD
ncbi:Carbon catabolite repressor protein 4-like protein 4 [Hibiscus syriacus]|uniref:Carbon catabolite repressor protein 4-like protein 4 n=1 Tax=Hibiscus syriacus TaxID=106335 RepID=A0A6A2XL63_HIBSY|nr:Carbon catabolite repressor protein 4-like protein 4 [Hibiscus syriacus]